MESNKSNEGGMSAGKKLGLLILVLFLIASIAGLILFYQKYQKSQQMIQTLKENQGDQQITDGRKQEIIDKLSKHTILPDSEPALATISNPEKMAKRDDFFKVAKEGDVMLVYPSKAIMYRPDEDKIVDMRPVVRRGNQELSDRDSAPLEIELRGRVNEQQARSLANQINSVGSYNVSRTIQTTSSYENTTIVNTTEQDINQLENSLNTEAISTMPDTESTSTADIVILIGQNLIQ